MKEFTLQELKRYNGKNGMPAYVAYEGKVYDLSSSFLWRGGRHQTLHEAGEDLTESLKEAPHGPEFLERFPVGGRLVDGSK